MSSTSLAHDVLVIGAGFAGLATAARLRQRGVTSFAILEQGADVGEIWRGHYDRIQLHSPFHDLPDDGNERRKYGVFLKRDQLLDYLAVYARRHAVYEHARFGERVTRVRKTEDGWELAATSGTHTARFLAIATASNRRPVMPELPGRAAFRGRVLHSRTYRNPAPFAGQRVLVVGSGNSGAEIALDLARGGARHVALWVRAPRWVISLRRLAWFARAAHFFRIAFTPDHLRRDHAVTRDHPRFEAVITQRDAFMRRCAIDLRRFGVRQPEEGPARQTILRGRIPWFDVGTAAAVAAGSIAVIDGQQRPIVELVEDGVRLGEGVEPFDALILCTGFEPGLEEFVEDAGRLLAVRPETGLLFPRTDGRSVSTVEPTLFFPGFDLNVNGGLSLGLWGYEVADRIADSLGGRRAEP